ncbi:conserved hypothetical protein [Listeria monocytogenes]|nr:hypothetical protein NT04LM_0987 [Listeria monocytogenes FSL F2-208]CUM31932.1 conserved hypothetical protein [Listeria monocytogenes]
MSQIRHIYISLYENVPFFSMLLFILLKEVGYNLFSFHPFPLKRV